MQIEITYIENDGMVAVIPNGKRLDRNLAYAQKRGADIDALKKSYTELLEASEATGKLQKASFDIKPYTYGQKNEAERVSTVVVNGEWRIQPSKMNIELMAASTGLKVADIEKLSPGVANALLEEVLFVSEPDPERLLFLSALPTDGDSPAQK